MILLISQDKGRHLIKSCCNSRRVHAGADGGGADGIQRGTSVGVFLFSTEITSTHQLQDHVIVTSTSSGNWWENDITL